nr:MAG TPA: hypothetical protein [Crassvirales sp.]
MVRLDGGRRILVRLPLFIFNTPNDVFLRD